METVAKSGLFRGAFRARRCIVPADAFYEREATETGKQPSAIARQDGQPMAFLGPWEGYRWADDTITRTFTSVTTTANAVVAGLHDPMPVILEPGLWPAWLGEADGDPAYLRRPAPDGMLRSWPVSRRVDTPRNNATDLLRQVVDAVP